MNRAQRRAAGLKGKRLKKIRERELDTAIRTYLYVIGYRSNGRAVDEAIYNRLKGEQK